MICGPGATTLAPGCAGWNAARPRMECWSCGELDARRQTGADMPVPKVVGRWNKAGLNRLTRHYAPWMPGLGVVVHRGRRSGRRHQTPVNVFSAGDSYVIALTYGPGDGLGQERPGRWRLRTPHPRPDHPAGLTAPVSRPEPLCHPARRAAGTADPERRRLPVPHPCAGRPGSTRPIPSLTAPGGSTANRQRKVTTGLTGQSAQHRRSSYVKAGVERSCLACGMACLLGRWVGTGSCTSRGRCSA